MQHHMTTEDLASSIYGKTGTPYDDIDSKIKKAYSGPFTHGPTLTQMATAMYNDGFAPDTHVLLSWFSQSDIHTIDRALEGETDPVVKNNHAFSNLTTTWGFNVLQPTNVRQTFRLFTDLESTDLKWVHQSLCDIESSHRYHDASYDTNALFDIIRSLTSITSGSVLSSMIMPTISSFTILGWERRIVRTVRSPWIGLSRFHQCGNEARV